jgi:ferredoxin-NADP reductase
VNLVVGGTGLTPAYAILRAILLAEKEDKQSPHVSVSMVFANKTISDVLLRDELQQLAQQYPEQFKLWHVVSQVSESEQEQWQYSTGRVNQVCTITTTVTAAVLSDSCNTYSEAPCSAVRQHAALNSCVDQLMPQVHAHDMQVMRCC